MKTISFDPGTNFTGYSIFENGTPIEAGVLRATSSWTQSKRLGHLLYCIHKILTEHKPDAVIVEEQFVGRNPKTSLVTARAMGLAIAVAGGLGIKVVGFTPSEVKKSVTGIGNADKVFVANKVIEKYIDNPAIKNIGPYVDKGKNKTDDIYDAVAINETFWLLGETRVEMANKKEKVSSRIL